MNPDGLLFGYLFFLIADQRIIPVLPLYVLDGVTAGFLLWWLFHFRAQARKVFFTPVFLVTMLIFISALFSLEKYFSLTSLGQVKSWLILPALAAMAYWSRQDDQAGPRMLLFWYSGIIVILFSLLPFVGFGNFTYDGRLEGLFTSPNFLGFFLSPGPLLAWYFSQGTKDRRVKRLYSLSAAFILSALFLTHSYAAWIAACVSLVVYFAVQHKNTSFAQWCIYGGVTLLLVIGVLMGEAKHGDKLHELLTLGDRSSLSSRVMIWKSALRMIEADPLWGIGMGNFQSAYLANQRFFPPYLEWAVPQPQNLFLAAWLEFGLLGLFALVALILVALKNGFDNRKKPQAAILFSLFLGTLCYGLVDTPLFGNALAFSFWMLLFSLLFIRSPR